MAGQIATDRARYARSRRYAMAARHGSPHRPVEVPRTETGAPPYGDAPVSVSTLDRAGYLMKVIFLVSEKRRLDVTLCASSR